MNKRKWRLMSLYSFIISVFSFIVNYFFYHFVTDDGITTKFQEVAGKPFVANLIGIFATLFLFFSVVSLLFSFVWDSEK